MVSSLDPSAFVSARLILVPLLQDEYVGLPRDHPESYHTFMYTNFFSKVDINPANIHLLDGEVESGRTCCTSAPSMSTGGCSLDSYVDGHFRFELREV